MLRCELCPKQCRIAEGQSGECRVRANVGGRLLALTYGRPCAVHVDPVEKKPLFHFLPGTSILSLATVGCNLHCRNCQNWEISQENPESGRARTYGLEPERVPALARRYGCPSVAYTYTEPVVYFEYTLDCCRRARAAGLRNVLVSAGYANPAPWQELCGCVDAANIDIKAYSESFYRRICGGSLLPVLRNLVTAREAGVEVEVTNLIIPTLNDTTEMLRDLARWVARNLGRDTPLHFSRFFPRYRMRNLPPTSAATLDRARAIARAEGMRHVYIGNIMRPDGETTYCPGCGRVLVQRRGYKVIRNHLAGGRCPWCRTEVYGVWR